MTQLSFKKNWISEFIMDFKNDICNNKCLLNIKILAIIICDVWFWLQGHLLQLH